MDCVREIVLSEQKNNIVGKWQKKIKSDVQHDYSIM